MKLIPKIQFVNFLKQYPQSKDCWKEWFSIQKYWKGKIINIHIKHFCIVLDFRKNWIKDFING